jgi:hypothetical protein
MRKYIVIAEILHTRTYEVLARNSAAAEEVVREEFASIPFDTLEEEIQNVTVEDSEELD